MGLFSSSSKEGEPDPLKHKWKEGTVPEEEAFLPSRLLFVWARFLFRRASYLHKFDRALEHDDLLPLPYVDHGAHIGPIFEDAWKANADKAQDAPKKGRDNDEEDALPTRAELSGDRSSKRLQRALFKVMGRRFLTAGLVKVLNTALQFSFPLLLNAILRFIEDSQEEKLETGDIDSPNTGYYLSIGLFLAMAGKALTETNYFHLVNRAAYSARVAVSVAVYNKSMRLASADRQGTTLGELTNLMQVDATKIEMFVPQIHVLWDGIFQIAGYMAILYTLIGWPCLIGLVVMALAGPVQGKIMGMLFQKNRQMVAFTDARVKSTNEAVQGIRCAKMYTWEGAFQQRIYESRTRELKFLKDVAILRGFSRAYMGALPGIVAVVSFIVYAVAFPDEVIRASTLFAAIVAFEQLRFPLLFYPVALAQLAQAQVSASRVESFLNFREIAGPGQDDKDKIGNGTYNRLDMEGSSNGGEIIVNGATVFWSDPGVPLISESASTAKNEDSDDAATQTSVEVFPRAVLNDVSIHVRPGELSAIVGRVGSGKSSAVAAILNETVLESGEITLRGSVAYAAQSPWILNATVRDNILFGEPYDKEKYDRVLKACQLSHDLKLLDFGDMTEIGERGINLSGGQKQRVSVARAAYSNADIVILDDPLSALDPEVGSLLFQECIVKLMHGRTRLLVTNQLQNLQSCDTVVALGNGTVIEQGTLEDIMAKDDGEIRRLLDEMKIEAAKEKDNRNKESEESEEMEEVELDEAADDVIGDGKTRSEELRRASSGGAKAPEALAAGAVKGDGHLVTKEERNIGAVEWEVYRKYLKAGGGYCSFGIVYVGFILSAANGLMSNAWVTLWTADAEYERQSLAFYLGLYALTAVTLGVFTFMRSYSLAKFGVRASESLHRGLLKSILRAPMLFFDQTPTGRILSRFSKDLYTIDAELSDYFDFFLFGSLNVVISIGTIIFVTPYFAIAVVPLALIYFRVLNYFREVSRETKRLESISRSPVYQMFSETLSGLPTVRAFGQSGRFVSEFEGKIDQNTRAYYCNKVADRWLACRLELMGATIAGLAAVFSVSVVVNNAATTEGSDSNFASLAGLSLTYAISVTSILNWCVRSFAQLEAGMNASERVLYYTENIPQEAPSKYDELEKRAATISSDSSSETGSSIAAVLSSGGKAITPPANWPDKGEIILDNLRMKYREDTPFVLKGLSVRIAGGERVGVVGRTGSGKSSLLLCLLRIVEPTIDEQNSGDKYRAPITIDGVDILRIGTNDLRSNLGIIPQNPELFSGTIRSNMDPFDEHTDDEIWEALDRCGMKGAVEEMPDLLFGPVAEYGENLSQGQRQLLCLGRALLKKANILMLDEATSSVDFETDRTIQRTIREAFAGATVLTIAHRVNTIMDSDKILVLADGKVNEFASPKELLKDPNSTFSDIVRHAEAE